MAKKLIKSKYIILIVSIAVIFALTAAYHITGISPQASNIEASKLNSIDLDGNQKRTLRSFSKIDDFPVYVMHYYGDYGFSEYLKEGDSVSKYLEGLKDYNACSCVASLSDKGDKVFGRNFDYFYSPKLLLFTGPSNGYSSVSMVDMRHLGFLSEEDIANASPEDLKRLLDAPYLAFDGMNEYGLAVGEMTALGSVTPTDPEKVTLADLSSLRLVLDRAKTVDEAVALLENYNVAFLSAPPLHFMISDKNGKSAIIEFIEGEMKVIPNENPWQVSTNFLVYNSNEQTKSACWRYSTAERILQENEGYLTSEGVMGLLSEISQASTQWSVVYNMSNGDIALAIGKDYNDIKRFNLKMK